MTIHALMLAAAMAEGLVCPVMGHSVVKAEGFTDWNGVRVGYCCAGCVGMFESDPVKYMKQAAEDGDLVAFSLYDPVLKTRVKSEENELYRDFQGVRFYFANEENLRTFEQSPEKYGKLSKQEVFYCTVMGHGLESYAKAGAYADYNETRYYFCCPYCQASFLEDPEAFVDVRPAQKPGIATEKKEG